MENPSSGQRNFLDGPLRLTISTKTCIDALSRQDRDKPVLTSTLVKESVLYQSCPCPRQASLTHSELTK